MIAFSITSLQKRARRQGEALAGLVGRRRRAQPGPARRDRHHHLFAHLPDNSLTPTGPVSGPVLFSATRPIFTAA